MCGACRRLGGAHGARDRAGREQAAHQGGGFAHARLRSRALKNRCNAGRYGESVCSCKLSTPSARKSLTKRRPLSQRLLLESRANRGARGIEFDDLAGLRVLERKHADIGKLPLVGILDVDGDKIVTAIRLTHGPAQRRPPAGWSPEDSKSEIKNTIARRCKT